MNQRRRTDFESVEGGANFKKSQKEGGEGQASKLCNYNIGIQGNWQGQINKLGNKLNLQSLDIDESTFYNSLKNYYIGNVNLQLQNTEFSKQGKLLFYSKIRRNYELQDYLKFPIVKTVRSKLTN